MQGWLPSFSLSPTTHKHTHAYTNSSVISHAHLSLSSIQTLQRNRQHQGWSPVSHLINIMNDQWSSGQINSLSRLTMFNNIGQYHKRQLPSITAQGRPSEVTTEVWSGLGQQVCTWLRCAPARHPIQSYTCTNDTHNHSLHLSRGNIIISLTLSIQCIL